MRPWPRKRGEPALDVVVSPPGIGLLEPSGRKYVKEDGDGPISEVVGISVGRLGSVWKKMRERRIYEKRNTPRNSHASWCLAGMRFTIYFTAFANLHPKPHMPISWSH